MTNPIITTLSITITFQQITASFLTGIWLSSLSFSAPPHKLFTNSTFKWTFLKACSVPLTLKVQFHYHLSTSNLRKNNERSRKILIFNKLWVKRWQTHILTVIILLDFTSIIFIWKNKRETHLGWLGYTLLSAIWSINLLISLSPEMHFQYSYK